MSFKGNYTLKLRNYLIVILNIKDRLLSNKYVIISLKKECCDTYGLI